MPPIPSRPLVLVTGASRGIGLAVTRILLQQFDARVLTISRTISPELASLQSEHGKDITVVQGDLTDPQTSLRALSLSPSPPTALVLNAGLALLAPLAQTTPAHWLQSFSVNLFAPLHTLIPAIPRLREVGGRVVFVSSGAAVGDTAGWASYNASKAALNSLCRTLANEEPLLTSLAVRPGMVDTQMQADIRAESTRGLMKPSEHQRFQKAWEEGKLVRPEECGYVIAALAVSGGRELTGKFVSWDGEECAPYRRR